MLGREFEDVCFSAGALLNTDGRLNLQHVLDAENKAFSSEAIKKSWTNTGMAISSALHLIDRDLIMARALENYGTARSKETTVIEQSARATAHILQCAQRAAPEAPARIKLRPNTLYQAHELRAELVRQKAAQEAAAEEKKTKQQEKRTAKALQRAETAKIRLAERQAKKEEAVRRRTELRDIKKAAERCAQCHKSWNNEDGWVECEVCLLYAMCGPCFQTGTLMSQHEEACKLKPPPSKKSRRPPQSKAKKIK